LNIPENNFDSKKSAMPKFKYFKCDITNEESIQKSIDSSVKYMEGIDILVNNAGIGRPGNIQTTTMTDWNDIMKVNLTGTYLMSKHSMSYLLKSNSASIVNIASVAGLVAVKDRFAYSTSKGGVISLTKSIALDYVNENIRANSICPGTVDTPWVERITQDYDNPANARELMRQRQPMGRLGNPEEIAYAALYLASDESRFVTGTNMIVDGGLTMS
jgi:NAD(P)-dependent dehydrogenase (short-subunit alcohol dehydrogenase family)